MRIFLGKEPLRDTNDKGATVKRTVLISGMLLTLGLVDVPSPAAAADFCADKIPGPTYYQRNFSSGGAVVATICAPTSSVAGNAYLYARGSYANVQKYMSLSIHTVGGSTVSASGQYYSYLYRYRGAGNHDYHAIMYDGNGNKIVDGTAIDYQ